MNSNAMVAFEKRCLIEMSQNGAPFKGPLITDGEIHRYSRDHKQSEKDEWYRADIICLKSGLQILNCTYGSFSDGESKFRYTSFDGSASRDENERREIREALACLNEARNVQLENEKGKRKRIATEIWEKAEESLSNDETLGYLNHKQVGCYGVRYYHSASGRSALVIPIRNVAGELQGVQLIDTEGKKRIHGVKRGNFHLIGEVVNESIIYFAEGYSTGASVHEASGNPVVVAFDCGNLDPVIAVFRTKFPNHLFVIAADDDREAVLNVGKTKADDAAKKYQCGVLLPDFPLDFKLQNGKLPTDFNDLHVHFGIEEVQKQILAQQSTISQKETNCVEAKEDLLVHAQRLQFQAAHTLVQYPPKENWLIKSFLDLGSLSVVFGEPGSMKSFLAIDIAFCVATGREWHGFPVRHRGAVFYIAGEGFAGLSKRLRAWSLVHQVDLQKVPMFISDRPAQLLDELNTKDVISRIDELCVQHGSPVLVVVDTLNRNFGPGDENKTEDMTKFVGGIDASIRLKYGCAVLIVHHSPLNDAGRARGASALRGALDWEYCLAKHGDTRKLSATKVKDFEPPPVLFFKPKIVDLDDWVDEDDGSIMTSCVLEKVEGTIASGKTDLLKLKGAKKVAYNCLIQLLQLPDSDPSRGVHIDAWRDAAYQANISPAGTIEANKKAFQRAVNDLREDGYVEGSSDYWKLKGTVDKDKTFKGHVPDLVRDKRDMCL